MTAEPNDSEDTERLPDQAAQRLLARASELEAARSAELSLAELREVAREAGIGPTAFDQALAELRGGLAPAEAAPVDVPVEGPSRFRMALLTFGVIFVILAVLYVAGRMFPA